MDTVAEKRQRKRRLECIKREIPRVSRADMMWLVREIERLEKVVEKLEDDLDDAMYGAEYV